MKLFLSCNQHVAILLTRYTEAASECLASSNAVPCHYTDTVCKSLHPSETVLWHSLYVDLYMLNFTLVPLTVTCGTRRVHLPIVALSSDTCNPSIHMCQTHSVLQYRLSSVITDSDVHLDCVQCQNL